MGPRFVAAVVAALLVVSTNAGAQAGRPPAPPPADPDAGELAAYRLTFATFQKVYATMQAFSRALEADPKYAAFVAAQKELAALQQNNRPTIADQRRMEALEQQLEQMSREMDPGEAQTLAEMERKTAAMPHMAEALESTGLSAREYAKFTLTMIQSGYVAGAWQARQLRALPAGVSWDNVRFMIDHQREIAALNALMQGR